MKKVLVTGARGFVGRHSLPSLVERNYEVHAVSSQETTDVESPGVVWHKVDLLDRAQIFELISKVQPSHLLHFAWYAVPGKYWTSQENTRWLQASIDLLHAFGSAGGARIVGAGSCAEYEWGSDAPCGESRTPLKPATLYGACKNTLHGVLEDYGKQNGISTAWGRIFFLYGPHEHPDRLVPTVIRSLLRKEVARCTHGQQVRDLLHVRDVAEAFVHILDSDVQGAINIGSGQPAKLEDVIRELGKKLMAPELIELGAINAPANEPRVLVAETSRLREELGWKPRYELGAGLDDAIAWWSIRMI